MTDPVEVVNGLGAVWSPDLGAYAAGEINVPACVLCQPQPCRCNEILFGSDEYMARINRLHGR